MDGKLFLNGKNRIGDFMGNKLKINMYSLTLDCKEPIELAKFYEALLDWKIESIDEEYVQVYNPAAEYGACPSILLQNNPDYVSPVWPSKPDTQQQMAHIDFTVNNLEMAVEHAVNCGAVIAADQYSDNWRVMYDPAGHPFCLCL